MNAPLVSVIMPVYNGAAFIGDAIDSILIQDFIDFEFLIINDGSSDRTVEIIKSYTDKRIRLIDNFENKGLVSTLNEGLSLAAGEYIARMDCDDISFPSRLGRQVSFMDASPDVALCGTWAKSADSHRKWCLPVEHDEIVVNLLFNSTFIHSSVMIRRNFLIKHQLEYDRAFRHAEDYALWVKAGSLGRLANIPEVLLQYRVHDQQISGRFSAVQRATACKIRKQQLDQLAPGFTDTEEAVFHRIASGELKGCRSFLREELSVLEKLLRANEVSPQYDPKALETKLARLWLDLSCMPGTRFGNTANLH